MSENAAVSELTSQYAAQVTGDLERNAKEQERISGEIATLQEQLTALQRDHAVLVNIQQAIGTSPASAEPTVPSGSVKVPAPRKKKGTTTGAEKRAATKPPARRTGRATTGKTTAAKPADKSEGAKSAQPTLVDLVRRHLAEQREPRSAAEIATALGEAHPDRNVKTTVVRTTLEGLVAKTQAQRTKQGASVFYTPADAPEQAASPQSEEQPAQSDA
ncbi:hypothetical protein K4B79_09630 [Streptomyces lincolnensis]|uniref:hypothetical protein n=1 Tax=Streptomyces lincolnensis TaxID=1915 RepID=UPI001E44E301|nr:hypothetical protein [Streptomyces lincolnensis]MCD7438495.1 hypothetical protein [Streptomyces lincolnensis]